MAYVLLHKTLVTFKSNDKRFSLGKDGADQEAEDQPIANVITFP